MASDTSCPKCGAELEFDEVDIGVGVERGNFYCPECHWTPEAREYDTIPEFDLSKTKEIEV